MPGTTMRILFAGTPPPVTDEILTKLAARGFGAHLATKLSEAREFLEIFRLDIVLASESLADGRGYALADAMKRQSGTLIVGVPLSESCLWLPVVERGVVVLGKRAFSPTTLEAELDRLLGIRLLDEKKPRKIALRLSDGRPASDRTVQPAMRQNGSHRLAPRR
ncbi:MAG TPA: hypothetical protein VHX36_06560 [Candidatus Acidoferrales bacterium]|nr:hypothetical protein [Candidatus Acidoferrales bacterium]